MTRWSATQERALEALARDLERVFGPRLESLVAYAGHEPTARCTRSRSSTGSPSGTSPACLPLADGWRRRGLAVPLMLSQAELARTVDIFPLEYSSIISSHTVVRGRDPFDGITSPERGRPPRVRGAGQESSHPPARGLPRVPRRGRGHRAADRASARRSARCSRTSRGCRTTAAAPPTPRRCPTKRSRRWRSAHRRAGRARPRGAHGRASGQTTIADPTALLARYIDAAQRIWEYVDTMARLTRPRRRRASLLAFAFFLVPFSFVVACVVLSAGPAAAQPPTARADGTGQRLRPRHRRGQQEPRSTAASARCRRRPATSSSSPPSTHSSRTPTSTSTPSRCSRTAARASAERARTTAC